MEKNNIKHDIIDLLEIIVEQAEIINHYKHEIPQIELDILMENIRELYDNYKKLDKINKPVPHSSEPLNNPVNIPPSIQETTAKETYIPEIKLAEIPEIIEKLKKSTGKAKNEEDIRIATNIFLDGLTSLFEIKKDISSEVTSLQGGRADSIYSDIIFEFKAPKKFNNEKGLNEAIYGRDEKDRGLFHYLVNFSLEQIKDSDDEYFKYILTSKIGVGFDGNKFIFCRFKKSESEIQIKDEYKTKSMPSNISEKQNLDFEIEIVDNFELGVKKLLLFARSTKRKVLSAENLLESFSSSSKLTKTSIKYLYELLEKSCTFFQYCLS